MCPEAQSGRCEQRGAFKHLYYRNIDVNLKPLQPKGNAAYCLMKSEQRVSTDARLVHAALSK